MKTLAQGARLLPTHHITIRVPWQDSGWDGSVCCDPLANTSCLALPRIGEGRCDEIEVRCAGKRLDSINSDDLPPCVAERVSFMAPYQLTRRMVHPYTEIYPDTHGHFLPTPFIQPPYSAACVPFRWMLRGKVEGNAEKGEVGIAERLKIGYIPDREPEIHDKNGNPKGTAWIQERDNQMALLDTFMGAVRPEESLCFFYAKRTPLSEQSRRVIIGVGRVLSVGEPTEYRYSTTKPPLRSSLWERNVVHSIRPGFADGFLLPYREILEAADQQGFDPEDLVAFAPDEYFDAYSYGSEVLTHDGAVASLIACASALHRIKEKIEGPWDSVLKWIDTQLNHVWHARGPFPGLGSALSAFGYEWGFTHGSLLAYEIELLREQEGSHDSWDIVDAVMKEPTRLGGPVSKLLTPGLRKGWQRLSADRRALLDVLSRCAISEEQALRLYDLSMRGEAHIDATDSQLLSNPYLLFELDRKSPYPIAFGPVDRGLFPDEAVRNEAPLPEARRIEDPADWRRVRGLIASILEDASEQGHTLLPRSRVIKRARELSLQPPCPLGEGVLSALEDTFTPIIRCVGTKGGEPAYQLDRLSECRDIIRREVIGRRNGKPHSAAFKWREFVDAGLGEGLPEDPGEREMEERARQEKAVALEQLYRSRISVLVGSAGTGKTTLLRILCSIPDVAAKGLLLLAPTGKARVRLEEQTGLRGSGFTLAQFLIQHERYDSRTGAYFPDSKKRKCADYYTVIVDESSMLTEGQLAALIDALANVGRLILVGDSRQLPPIGAGRPFVDIVNELAPHDVETIFPHCGPCYGELTIPRRQKGESREDVVLASHFSGRPLEPGADEVWDEVTSDSGRLRLVEWSNPKQLHEKIVAELVDALGLEGPDDELGFEEALGGQRYGDFPWAFFWNKFKDNPGAASRAESWQMLSPVRAGMNGVDALNRMVQERFRHEVAELALEEKAWLRKIPKPMGAQKILYGDKVINVVNRRRYDVFPKPEGETYIANGDIGLVVGQYKTKKLSGVPWKIEVEFAGQLGLKYGFFESEFGDEGANPLELAYCLTVHKTQGSEFGVTFVILPNPCRLLSRELLYTALTRHKDRLVILHQGSIRDFLRYSHDEHSEIARRMTNLFSDPSPREVDLGTEPRILEDGLIHRTERGDLVRSKSELVIADKMFAHNIYYLYEQSLQLPSGHTVYPDFTIRDERMGTTFYWEHLGMLDDPSYKARWQRKRERYRAAGILALDEGGGEAGTLIETRDEPNGGLDAEKIARIIEKVWG